MWPLENYIADDNRRGVATSSFNRSLARSQCPAYLDKRIYCSYSNICEIKFDPTKDEANQAKHGVSLALASELDWEAALVWIDARVEYGELRMIALAPKSEILYYVAFVDRGDARRITSLRRANRREVKYYVENI